MRNKVYLTLESYKKKNIKKRGYERCLSFLFKENFNYAKSFNVVGQDYLDK